MWSQLAVSLQHLNPYLVTILVLGFIGTIVVFERLIMLQLVYNLDFKRFVLNLKKTVQANDIDRAINVCKSASRTSLPQISLKALEASERDPSSVRGVIEEETTDFLPQLETRLSVLPALATMILLIGILGTIDTLWGAFDSIAVLDTSEKQANLAQGIAASLNPTALGLMCCLLFIAAHHLLKSMALKLTDRIHYGVTVLTNLLSPAEFTTFQAAPVIDTGGFSMPAETTSFAPAAPVAAAKKEVADDNFDDASVEDIKDEEEII